MWFIIVTTIILIVVALTVKIFVVFLSIYGDGGDFDVVIALVYVAISVVFVIAGPVFQRNTIFELYSSH